MAQVPVNPSPKQRFQAIKHCVDAHRELMQRPDMAASLDAAFNELQWELCGGNLTQGVDGNSAAAKFYKLMGAHEYIRTLRTLAEQIMVTAPKPLEAEIKHEFK